MTSRLTDEQLADVDTICDTTDLGVAPAIVRLLLAELRTLRAAALSEEERYTLLWVHDIIKVNGMPGLPDERKRYAIAALHRLTAKEM